MPITDSRLKGGTLTLDGTAFAKQAAAVSLVPDVSEEGDAIETLDGSTLEPEEVITWSLNIGLVQDFDDAEGLVEFLRSRAGEVVDWTWEPNVDSPTYSGTVAGGNGVKLRAATIGGDVNVRLTSEVEMPLKGEPAATYPA